MKPASLYKFLNLFILFVCLSPDLLFSQGVQKEILKNFEIGPRGQVSVIHKNGDIKIQLWDNHRVMVKAVIIVKGNDQVLARSLFENVEVDVTRRGNKLELKTNTGNFDDKNPGSENNPILAGKTDKYRMDYIITMPRDASLLVNQQFGDLYMDEFQSPVSLVLSHGKVNIREIKGTADFNFNYITGSIQRLNQAYLEANRSNLHVNRANHLNIYSAYSEFQIDKADSLISSHKHNEFDISDVAYLKMDEEYSEVKVANLSEKGDLSLNYGDVDIKGFTPNLTNLNLFGELTDFKIATGNKSSYEVDIDSKETKFHLPQDLVITKQSPSAPAFNSHTRLQGVKEVKNLPQKTKPKIVIVTKDGQVILQ
ncbi:MAG: hypothetical protein KDD99_04885 [Bacteroidetes bacterium]|nr:hypothetical protein [Bacteroidota bacterium]